MLITLSRPPPFSHFSILHTKVHKFYIVTFNFNLISKDYYELSIYDIYGSKVKIISSGRSNTETYEVKFDSRQISNGVYFNILETSKRKISRKMIIKN